MPIITEVCLMEIFIIIMERVRGFAERRWAIGLVVDDFPFWLRFAHFINVIFLTLLIRSGFEILSTLPKLYWKDHAKPGTEWIKFTKKEMPKDKLWTSIDEEESFSSWIVLPGRKNLGLGRHWNFFCDFLACKWRYLLYLTFFKWRMD